MSTGSAATLRRGRVAPGAAGFTYIAIMIAVVLLGVSLAATGMLWETAQRRERERELLFVGNQFRRAVGLYYERTPGNIKQFPRKLEDLLQDNRFPNVQRYLRKIYPDPITGKVQWGLVEYPGIGITGVYSLSDKVPIKSARFPSYTRNFDMAKTYADWRFEYLPGQGLNPSGAAPAPGQPQIPGAR
jgi:type II secretory pathway pseudopilin PulG